MTADPTEANVKASFQPETSGCQDSAGKEEVRFDDRAKA